MKQKTTKILNALNDAGQFNKVAWRSILKTRKDFPGLVEKVVCAVVSAGTDYANRKSVREAIDNGEREEIGALPWGQWLQFPHVIAHTNKAGDYNEYIRLYPPSEAQKDSFRGLVATATYFINGKPATKEDCIPLCLASAFPTNRDEPVDCIAVNVDNVLTVGGIAV